MQLGFVSHVHIHAVVSTAIIHADSQDGSVLEGTQWVYCDRDKAVAQVSQHTQRMKLLQGIRMNIKSSSLS